jgi:hypothetical protein
MYSSDISVDQVIESLQAFVAQFMPANAHIVRGQVNRVPMPANPVAVLTELMQTDLEVPHTDYQPDDDTATIYGPSQINVQIDFYDRQAGEYCKAVKTAFRSAWGFGQFPANIKPLYTSDGNQSPLLTGEEQYESRWTITVYMQYNPTITVPQQFADELVVASIASADDQ